MTLTRKRKNLGFLMATAELEPTTSPGDVSPPSWTAVLHEWLVTVDHKKIGIMYVLMAVLFLIIGGCMALMMRLQLWAPGLHFVEPITFNQFFTLHGTTMVFFVGMP